MRNMSYGVGILCNHGTSVLTVLFFRPVSYPYLRQLQTGSVAVAMSRRGMPRMEAVWPSGF